ncbi:hypothetical protein AAH991_00640 [Microbispora sp. ZYX-F-249]|uniref:Uncharacterized protein n=1 Tax=Microbispora maris TaxID=3144104 RepID=A0ABV0AE27_9ACTN
MPSGRLSRAPLLTLGQDTGFLSGLPDDYSAADVVDRILQGTGAR